MYVIYLKFNYYFIFLFLVINTRKDTLKKIEEECKNLYTKKIEIRNTLNKKIYGDNRIYELKTQANDDKKTLGRLNLFLPKFLNSLWENPEIVASMLMGANPKDINKTLIPLIGDNFYENILSSKYLQSNLIYVITLLLKYEINNYSDEYNPEKFLDVNSPCGYLLYELRSKNDCQIFIKTIIEDIVNKIDEYSYNICFDIVKINENISDNILDIKHERINNANNDLSEKDIIKYVIRKRLGNVFHNQKKIDKFINKYMTDIDFGKDYKNEIDKDIINYYNKNILQRKNSFLNYISNYFKETIDKQKYNEEVVLFYENDFSIVKNFIEEILKNLINNINIIPYSIKAICKTISLLIKKKFPNISKIKHNAFVSRFFFCNLFSPILQDSSLGAITNNFIISKNTMNNLQIIMDIFLKFIMGKLYVDKINNFLSPFNRFFIEKMSDLIKFIDNLLNVNIPKYIENVINDNNDFKFNIYKEYKDEGFMFRSICFSLDDIIDIIKNILRNQDKILIDKNKSFNFFIEKLFLNENSNMIDKLKKEEEKNNKLYYFLFTDCLFLNDKIKKLFDIYQPNNHYQIKEIKNPLNDEDISKNLIIKTKNFLCKILFNFILLTREDFSKDCSMNINDIFKELLTLSKIPNYIVDNKIPTQWYVSSIIEILPKLPKEITDNNCQKLFEELINEVNLSIKELDFESLTLIHSKLNFTKRSQYSIENTINIIKNMTLNEKVESISKSDNIEVGLLFHYDGDNTVFNVCQKKSILDFNVIENDRLLDVEYKISNTIDSFIKNFPDFTTYQLRQDIDILEFEEKLQVPEQLFTYFKIVNNYLQRTKKYSEGELSEIKNKIYDYVMLKLYDKLFPQEPIEEENKNYKKTILYSWTESKHFIKEKPGAIYNSFLPDVIQSLKLILKEKSPRKKIENLSKAFKAIKDVIEFNGGTGLLGVDNFMPILSYSYIKAQPFRMYSSIKYAMLYNPSGKTGSDSQNLTELLGVSQFVTNLSFEKLINITKEEFDQKMKSNTNQSYL